MSFMDQFERARIEVRRIKKFAPWMLPQWQEYRAAKDDLVKAQQRVKKARKAWRELGENPR